MGSCVGQLGQTFYVCCGGEDGVRKGAPMGLLKMMLNANNAEGIREAMRMAYRKHCKHATQYRSPEGTNPHQAGLFGAMASRMAVNNLPVTEQSVWLEVLPFMLIEDEENSAEALAEYAVYVERTVDTKIEGLKETLNGAFRRAPEGSEFLTVAAIEGLEHRRWHDLLENDVKEKLATIRSRSFD